MDIDEKLLMELAEQAGIKEKVQGAAKEAEEVIDKIKGRSEDQLLNEILALKKEIKKDPAQYDRQISTIKALAGVMKGEQRQRLDKVIALLENDD